ncbi:E3 SUMO-protein ligase ZBED1-like [Bactrocera neohumeralis]|nr:E3 SUMO-protein ligase ZBED1-like [Bactrocera neohumeralis]
MVASDVLPLNVVNNVGLTKLIHELDPRYKMPSKTHLRNVLLKNEYNSLKETLKAELQIVESVALTTDGWSSRANESYLTVTCHFVTESFELASKILSTNQLITPTNHSAVNIADTINNVVTEWGLQGKVVCVVTDNDATMKKACELLKIMHIPCFAHTINLLVQDVLKLPCVSEIIVKCKRTVAFFKASNIAYAKFKEEQGVNKPYSLIQEVPTRWNSALFMMQRILETNEAISRVLLKTPKSLPPFTADEITLIKELVEILNPFQDATVSVSADTKVTISLIIPTCCELRKQIFEMNSFISPEAKLVVDYLRVRMAERFSQYEERTATRLATILDPRFKKDGFLQPSNAEQAKKALELEVSTFLSKTTPRPQPTPPQPKRFSFMSQKLEDKVKSNKADAIILLRQYFETAHEAEEVNPLDYWKEHTKDTTALAILSKKYFCVPASSCASERAFSKAGQIVSDRRCALKSNIVDKLLFLNKNQKQ